ncbi:vomeronasal type-1 receptor 1-like [Dasypus novemcinctus]|uniref:vomeronasal type-1 receptor 1-like n=1 Tax=Dasypus novemcinctus TaxID=9361 RepID=UPI0003288366|nr:vomeronasal type-1 receptor 1-like [Dasypus novemcinctus]
MGPLLAIIFLFLTGLGILGNSLLVLPILIFFTGQRPSPIHVIIAQLALGNFMLLLFRGMPLVILNWGKKYFLDDVGCTFVFYLQRVGRGMSICSTCLLSGCQAIIVSSLSAKWAHLKQNALKYSVICSFLCWVFNAFIYVFILTEVKGPKKQLNITSGIDLGYCYWVSGRDYQSIIYSARDVIFVVLMIWSCGYMLYFLCRHRQQVRHIHSTSLCPSTNPEIRATKRILLLVITFVSFYSVNCCLILYITYFAHISVWILDTSAVMTLVYPTISPFLLMANGSHIFKWCTVFREKKLLFCSDCGFSKQ